VVLDLKAGLEASVIEFLPYSNSGILVFTPHHPAATLAAADIVKAILFRKLRVLFAAGSPVYADLGGLTPRLVQDLLDRVEDVYDSAVHNLDAFVADLHHALGDHPVFKAVAAAVDSFVVYYVLNRFDGIKSSYDTAVRPFVESLAESVSAHMTILNLGWVPESEKINLSNMKRVPALLSQGPARRSPRPSTASCEAASLHLPRRVPPEKPKSPSLGAVPRPRLPRRPTRRWKRMYQDIRRGLRENFAHLTARSLPC
jgi:MinD-like ATPase involved in chromosome partitioning or flagellar assembly